MPSYEIPYGATDCGDGFYIETLYDDRTKEPYFRSCSPGGATCRYSSDLWQAQIYVEHLRGHSSQSPA